MIVMLGLLALGLASAPRCEGATETLEPLADHLPPAVFTADHQVWLRTVIGELPGLTGQLATLPAGSEPSKVAALRARIAMLQAERQDLEAHQHLWQTYRQEMDSTTPSFVQGGKPAPTLDRAALLKLCHVYLNGAEFIRAAAFDESVEPDATESISSSPAQGGAPTPTLESQVAPSANEWEYLADRFERLLRTAQTSKGADGIAPELPRVGEVAGAGRYFTNWPQAHSSVVDESTVTQARALLSDFCPWGAQTYRILAASGLMTGFDWRALPPYGSEKISVAVVPARWLPGDIEQDMTPIITGAFAAQMGAKDFRWRIQPVPTYTVWFVSPRVHDLQASTVFTYALKANKLIFAGPEALLIDELKGLAIETVRAGGLARAAASTGPAATPATCSASA